MRIATNASLDPCSRHFRLHMHSGKSYNKAFPRGKGTTQSGTRCFGVLQKENRAAYSWDGCHIGLEDQGAHRRHSLEADMGLARITL